MLKRCGLLKPLSCSFSLSSSHMFLVLFIIHVFSVVHAYESHDHPNMRETGPFPYGVLNHQVPTFGSQVTSGTTCGHRYESISTEKENRERTQQVVCPSSFQKGMVCKIYPLSSFCKCVCSDPRQIRIRSQKHYSSQCSNKNKEECYGDMAYLQDSREYRSLETCTYRADEANSLINDDLMNEELNVADSREVDVDTSPICIDPALTSQEIQNNSSMVTNASTIYLHREIDGAPFNYASDSKGAKVLSSNREAKGAMNLLNKDKDKYFWTPCNAESKYIDIELSEETLVVEIVIANYEFFSSNVRDFQLWGSSTYPIEVWVLLGNFEAENCRISQKFILGEPKWVRYLRFEVLNHYGSDFYCTLSALEVHGVDAIEWLLEEWFAESYGHSTQKKCKVMGHVDEKGTSDHLNEQNIQKIDHQCGNKAVEKKRQPEYHQIQRPALDGVMKLMMEKIQSLEQTQPHFLQLKELDDGYRDVLTLYVNKLNLVKVKLEESTTQISIQSAQLLLMGQNWYQEKHDFESDFSDQIKMWITEFDSVRTELKIAEDKQVVAMIVTIISVLVVVGIQVLVFCQTLLKQEKRLLSVNQILLIVPLLSSVLVVLVLLP